MWSITKDVIRTVFANRINRWVCFVGIPAWILTSSLHASHYFEAQIFALQPNPIFIFIEFLSTCFLLYFIFNTTVLIPCMIFRKLPKTSMGRPALVSYAGIYQTILFASVEANIATTESFNPDMEPGAPMYELFNKTGEAINFSVSKHTYLSNGLPSKAADNLAALMTQYNSLRRLQYFIAYATPPVMIFIIVPPAVALFFNLRQSRIVSTKPLTKRKSIQFKV